MGFVRPVDDVQEFLFGPGLADRRRDGDAERGIVALPGQGGHPVPLELGEARRRQDEVVDEIGVLEFPRREIVELHPREGPADEVLAGGRPGLFGPGETVLIRKPRDRMEQGGDDAGVPVGGGSGQDDAPSSASAFPDAPFAGRRRPARGGRGQVLIGLGVERARLGEQDDGRRDLLGQLVEPGVERPDLGQPARGEAADEELEAAGVGRQAELALGGQADDIAGVLLGPAVEDGVVPRVGRGLGDAWRRRSGLRRA